LPFSKHCLQLKNSLPLAVVLICWFAIGSARAAAVLYIHGDVAADGTVPSGSAAPFDQMLLDDTGDKGLSTFKATVEQQGHTISQRYDQQTTLNASLLDNYDVIVFGLHQKLWSAAEKSALDTWLKAGGSMFIYSDSASGGRFNIVGAQNDVGQTVTNNLIAQYGLQVTVDQADGTFDFPAVATASNVIPAGQRLEGEGVSPVAVSDNPDIEVLIPFTRRPRFTQGITIPNPGYAALALRSIESGHVAVMFDRQPMWNSGPGSDIGMRDNQEILRRLIDFLAERPATPPPPTPDGDSERAIPILWLLLDE